jgi:uncharacterized protein with PIN domain
VSDIKVVDASALAALLFADPEAETIANRLEGARLATPLLDFELANVCLIKDSAPAKPTGSLRTAFRLADRLRVETVAVGQAASMEVCRGPRPDRL